MQIMSNLLSTLLKVLSIHLYELIMMNYLIVEEVLLFHLNCLILSELTTFSA